MAKPVDRSTAEHYVWGGVSDGWRLLDRDDLSVIEECVPPGGAEEWHVHAVARQFFVLLDGSAVVQTTTGDLPLRAGQGVEIAPGLAHRFTNPGAEDVRFLVISSPTTRGDRQPSAAPPLR
ncbi:cupin domain-containing protein [Solicola gregarius]|uniref:Cupin domain-containing protein n=1 Tax=Solicola gregarius TaxID=2908642 RepID=A0AA46TJN7_9ACTN|nr:cupin domain-containing protein [Solicola gregarius]UYM06363.1 cupin domain-containing protein [Solicola gregarius]